MRVVMITGRKRYIFMVMALAILVVVLICWPLRAITASSGERLVPIYEVDTPKQAVAISFDASWGAEYTQQILDTLDQYGVKTTFFLVNIWLDDYPEIAKTIAERGHEIGLHSVSHPKFTTLSEAQIRQELLDNCRRIAEVTNYQATLFRPPFGDYNNQVIATTRDCGFEAVQWSIDSLDWKDLSAEEIFQRVTKDIHAGDIVLFHNNGLHTAEALVLVLDYLAAENLAVVPVCELLLSDDYYVDANGIQHQQ